MTVFYICIFHNIRQLMSIAKKNLYPKSDLFMKLFKWCRQQEIFSFSFFGKVDHCSNFIDNLPGNRICEANPRSYAKKPSCNALATCVKVQLNLFVYFVSANVRRFRWMKVIITYFRHLQLGNEMLKIATKVLLSFKKNVSEVTKEIKLTFTDKVSWSHNSFAVEWAIKKNWKHSFSKLSLSSNQASEQVLPSFVT